MTDTEHGDMTAFTPQQMRELADEWDTEQKTFGPDLEVKTAAALRSAAAQLEAVRSWLDGQDSAEWDSVYLDALDAISAADTAPRDGRDECMTDPVNMDDLRAIIRDRNDVLSAWEVDAVSAGADELDRLRAALVEARAASDRYSQELSERREQSMLNEGRLRAVIENAPHYVDADGRWCRADAGDRCTCWKAQAL